MQTRIQSTMGMNVPFEVPSTIEEFAEACGVAPEQAAAIVLKYAVDEGMFRTVLPNFRPPFFEALSEETGVERRVIGHAKKTVDGEVTEVPIYEKDGSYMKHVLSETDKEASAFEPLAASISADTPFDLRAKPRSGKPGKEYLERANGLLAAVNAGRGSWEAVINKLTSLNNVTIETGENGNPEPESLARALKVDSDRRSKEQVTDLI